MLPCTFMQVHHGEDVMWLLTNLKSFQIQTDTGNCGCQPTTLQSILCHVLLLRLNLVVTNQRRLLVRICGASYWLSLHDIIRGGGKTLLVLDPDSQYSERRVR